MNTKRIKKGISGFFNAVALTINIVVAASLLLCYAASFIGPDKFWPVVLISLSYPVLLLLNFIFLIYWLLRFRKWFFLSLITILIGWGFLQSYVKLFGNDNTPEDHSNLRVMSFNVKDFDHMTRINKEKGSTRKKIFQMIDRENPGIICFQAFYSESTRNFNTVDTLSMKYGFKYYHAAQALVRPGNRFSGTATFSKYPIVFIDRYRFSNILDNVAIITDIAVNADTFRVFNIHFKSNMLSTDERLIFSEIPTAEKQEETVNKFWEVTRKVRQSSELRASQSREIRALVESSPYPVILCCDLNDTNASYAYRQVTRNLKDSFVGSGKGFGSSHIGLLPILRIDYILHDPFFSSWGFKTIREHLSDHYPIVTNLAYKSGE